MQIQNNPQIQAQSNFRAIKTVKCVGMYKKFPKEGAKLVKAFKESPTAMEFCKKHDVDIVFHACKDMMTAVRSSIHIFFDNPAKSKFLGIFGSKRDEIKLSAWGDQYSLEESIVDSTDALKAYISETPIANRPYGLLKPHINYKNKEIEKFLDKKSAKEKNQLERNTAIETNATKLKNDSANLKNNIDDLINNSKM